MARNQALKVYNLVIRAIKLIVLAAMLLSASHYNDSGLAETLDIKPLPNAPGKIFPDETGGGSSEEWTNPHSYYYISCSPFPSGLGRSFSSPDLGAKNQSKFPMTDAWSINVSYFITVDGEQFIYGTLVDQNGSFGTKKIYVLSRDWECSLYKTP